MAGLPNLALASANSLFIEAFRAWEAAEQASSPVERLKLLEVSQAKLDEIVREHPDSDLAVQIVTRGKVGEFDLSLVAPALEEAREEIEVSDALDLSEHLDRIIEDIQRQNFQAAWNLQLNFLVSNFQEISSRSRASARSIMAWQIEREVSDGNISDAEDLAHVETIANFSLYSTYYYDGDSLLYHYLVEALLHDGRQEHVFRIISGLEGGLRSGAIDAAVVFLAKFREPKIVEKILATYSSEVQDSVMLDEVVAILMERGLDSSVEKLLGEVHDRDATAKILIVMAEAYLGRNDLPKAQTIAAGADIETWITDPATGSQLELLFFNLAAHLGEAGNIEEANYFLERAWKLDWLKQYEKIPELVGALVKVGRIGEAREVSGLSDSIREVDSEVLTAYFESLPTDTAISELSEYKDYLIQYHNILEGLDEGELYFRYLIHHKQFDAVEQILMARSKSAALDDKAIEQLFRTASRFLSDDEHQQYFIGWLRQLNQIRPSLDTTLHLVDSGSTAHQFQAGLNAIEAMTSKFDQQLFYWIFAQVAIDAENLTPNERSNFVADSLLQLIASVTTSFPSDRGILWVPLGEGLRAMALDRSEPEYWREWPAY